MQELSYELKGLNCAHCAQKIEDSVKKLDGISSAQLVFATRKLNISVEDDSSAVNIRKAVANTVDRIEPGIEILADNRSGSGLSRSIREPGIRKQIMLLAAAFALFLAGRLVSGAGILGNAGFDAGIFLVTAAWLVAGHPVIIKAVRNISRGSVFDENFLMTAATVGGLAVGQYSEAAAVMLFYMAGTLLQDMAVDRSRRSIRDLMDLRPDYANLRTETGSVRVDPTDVKPGDIIIIRPGEKVPLDCLVEEGASYADTSAMTGEPVPRRVGPGDMLMAGFINKSGLIAAKTVNTFEESAASRVLKLVEGAAAKKARVETLIGRFARYYTPAVVILAVLMAALPPIIDRSMDFKVWVYRALIFLVISCPCALVVSIPLTYFAGIGRASSLGILFKGGNYLEALARVEAAAFDKTGTLTEGVFKVTRLSAEGCSEEELLEYAAYSEAHSSHPIARSILECYCETIDLNKIGSYEETPGFGVKAEVSGKTVVAGSLGHILQNGGFAEGNVENPGNKVHAASQGTVVYVAVDGVYMGCITVSDMVKADAARAVRGLREQGVSNIVMLTGDASDASEAVGSSLGLDGVYSGLLPHQKLEMLEKLKKGTKGTLLFIGDGINDAPVLAGADIGVSMGAFGSDAAVEASDLVLMTDEPSKLIDAVRIARFTKRVALQNIALALTVKLLVMLMGALGAAGMWEAVFADVGVTLLAVLNALRVLKGGLNPCLLQKKGALQ